nr:hypothetical protein [Sphingomonas sp. CDS-1]
MLRTRALAVDDEGVIAAQGATNQMTMLPADTVVFISLNRSNRDLFDELVASGASPRIVGDANSPRFLGMAICEGNVAGTSV